MTNFFEKIKQSYSSINNLALVEYSFESILNYGIDLKVKFFLENYYNININTSIFSKYLTLWQYESLLHSLNHAKYNTLFYKNLPLDSNFIEKEIAYIRTQNFTIKEIENKLNTLIQHLPFTTSEDIRNENLSFLALSQDEVEGIVSVETSGTSSTSIENKKKKIFSSANDFESTIQFFFFGMQYLLQKQDERVALLISSKREGSIGHLFSLAMQRMKIPCKVLGFSTDYEKMTKDLTEFRATCLIGISWHILKLSSYIKENQIKHDIRSVLLSGDTASKNLKNALANNLSCKVFNHYGITEFGFAGAVECMQHKNLHERPLDLYVEILNEDNKPVNKGHFGEIVITSLTREAMPLIRYKTGDRGRIIEEKCPCGSFIQSIEVLGRITQGIQINKDIFLHLTDFQNFFFGYIKQEYTDFEINVFNHIEGKNTEEIQEKILLIALDFSHEIEEVEKELRLTQEKFIQYFKLDLKIFSQKNIADKIVKPLEYEIDSIKYLHFISLQEYQDLLKTTSEHFEQSPTHFEKTHNFDSLIKEFSTQKNMIDSSNSSAKKKIHFLQGNFLNFLYSKAFAKEEKE